MNYYLLHYSMLLRRSQTISPLWMSLLSVVGGNGIIIVIIFWLALYSPPPPTHRELDRR